MNQKELLAAFAIVSIVKKSMMTIGWSILKFLLKIAGLLKTVGLVVCSI